MRGKQVEEWLQLVRPRLAAGLPERPRLLLSTPEEIAYDAVREIAAEAGRSGDYSLALVSVSDATDPVAAAVESLRDSLTRLEVGLNLEEVKHGSALHVLVEDLGNQMARLGRVALIHFASLDRVRDEAALSQLLTAIADASTSLLRDDPRRHLPVAFYLTADTSFSTSSVLMSAAAFAGRFATQTIDGDT